MVDHSLDTHGEVWHTLVVRNDSGAPDGERWMVSASWDETHPDASRRLPYVYLDLEGHEAMLTPVEARTFAAGLRRVGLGTGPSLAEALEQAAELAEQTAPAPETAPAGSLVWTLQQVAVILGQNHEWVAFQCATGLLPWSIIDDSAHVSADDLAAFIRGGALGEALARGGVR
ncbi:hypothetical protein GCM10023225_12960 [Kineococcus glutinatus]|uniref:Uncharacterized protein n=2 Tax=Kineococcus glutinatus TaxID=1070872 RepID=A0ABP9HKR9_9ACTN